MEKAKIFSQELHHRVIKKFRRRPVIVTGVDEIWAMDTAFMESYAADNDGYKYILCIVDCLSKYAWCVPLKNKTASTVLNAVKNVIEKSGRKPEKIWVDKGTEWYNKEFQNWAKINKIEIYSTFSESKSVIAESFIKTIKTNIQKHFTATHSRNWIGVLNELVSNYNNHKHSTIKLTPIEASKPENHVQAYINLRKSQHVFTKGKPKFKVGDLVRVSRLKGTFEKGYDQRFTYEVFTVDKVLDTSPITYKLKDYHGDPIDGSFYTEEMLKTEVPDYYIVDKILKKRKKGKVTQVLVRFLGWPPKFDEYIDEKDIINI